MDVQSVIDFVFFFFLDGPCLYMFSACLVFVVFVPKAFHFLLDILLLLLDARQLAR